MTDSDADPRRGLGRDLERELGRVDGRLRAMPLDRLERPSSSGPTPAELVHAAAQTLADLAADGVGRPRRPLPELAPHGLADQLVVTVNDVLDEGREPELRQAVDVLVALRRAL
ncbi:hypothetical protein [Angustibacter luteus]|uniref:Uncharacterized protein n=1 Tax=Angustibacter luteus TaxID=658456 RepID=A0ABW1JHM3_9ACTN